jgi:hypothetical protein
MSAPDFETRLKQALAPVEPPVDMEQRLEMTLGEIVEIAADELEAWELNAFKDPRNWVRIARPAAAVVIGTGAAVGLVVLRTQRKRHRRRASARNALDLVDSTLRDFGREALRVFDDIR